ncbi:MerR family transcriptional regulator [Streptomyces acidicola]|uniref:MerR family transcriptional regulator n=1 Tax=Streptomyces acidicola TaxID=2596892 RepID=UPI0038143371
MDDERPDVLTIGQLAHRTGLRVRTLRFWSDEGAVPPVARSASGRLARLSAAEREQIIDEFKEEVFGGLDVEPRLGDRIRALSIELPDDPTPEQVDAWIELAELVRDPGFRARLRTWMELNTPVPGQGRLPGASIWWARQVMQTVAEVRKRGIAPEGPEAADILSELFGDADRAAVLHGLEAGIEAGAERYRKLACRPRARAGFGARRDRGAGVAGAGPART